MNFYLMVVKTLFVYEVNRDRLTKSPFSHIKGEKEKMKSMIERDEEYYDKNEINAFFNASMTDDLRHLFSILFLTGFRISELQSLTWQGSIDLENKLIKLRKYDGYDTKTDFDKVIKEFDEIVGKERISVFHINDSKNEKSAGKDRHENIGFGYIGFDALNYIVNHPDFIDVPKILETPYVSKTVDSKDRVFPPYKEEIEMFRNQIFDPEIINKIRKKDVIR